MSLGLSWAHILGDFFSASSFINLWAQILSGHVPPASLHVPPSPTNSPSPASSSFKPVAPVGDLWIASNGLRMGTLSLRVTAEDLEHLHVLSARPRGFSTFELISAVLWKSISRARDEAGRGTRTAVVCENVIPRGDALVAPVNGMAFYRVEADFSAAEAEVKDILGALRGKKGESRAIGSLGVDQVAYGTELTFVDLEGLHVGGVEINGEKAVLASYTMGGVGDGGVVLILPEVARKGEGKGGGTGRRVTVILPEAVMEKVRDELTVTWGL